MSQGSRFGGHTMFVKNGKLCYTYNFLGLQEQTFASDGSVPAGRVVLGAEFIKEKEEPRGVANGKLRLYINDKVVGEGSMRTQPGAFGLAGGGSTVGRSGADPVTAQYRAPFAFGGGVIRRVAINVSGAQYVDEETEAIAMLARE